MNLSLQHYVAYLRPRCFLPTFLMCLTGYAISPTLDQSPLPHWVNLPLLFLLHCVFIWGSANAYNSSHDRDSGPVNLLPNPPPLPKYLLHFSLALKCCALLLAAMIGWTTVAITATAVGLSLFYSTRSKLFRRGKEIPVVDILINALGCGLISIALGYSFTGAPIDLSLLGIGLAFSVAIFGGLPTSQIFQINEQSRYRVERNYTSLLGPRWTLRIGSWMLAVHLLLLVWVLPPDFVQLRQQPVAWGCWLGWAICVSIALLHSWWWSYHPFARPYRRMLQQFSIMMVSQGLWTIAIWLT